MIFNEKTLPKPKNKEAAKKLKMLTTVVNTTSDELKTEYEKRIRGIIKSFGESDTSRDLASSIAMTISRYLMKHAFNMSVENKEVFELENLYVDTAREYANVRLLELDKLQTKHKEKGNGY
jgi:hypothetical protein